VGKGIIASLERNRTLFAAHASVVGLASSVVLLHLNLCLYLSQPSPDPQRTLLTLCQDGTVQLSQGSVEVAVKLGENEPYVWLVLVL
jgi:hypothetical protein